MFSDVKAKKVFEYFERISQIPRGSGNEKEIADYIAGFAADRGLRFVHDEANNVLVRKAASAGAEDKPITVLQGHTDMVCEADPGVKHDFLRDPIKFIRNGDILSADGTTLGADNGIAVAIMLALLDDCDLILPELECLFTSGEEVGMDGMEAFDASLLRGRRMINMDSAGEGIGTVSCAGGVRTDFSYSPCKQNMPENGKMYRLTVGGLYGGHSGEDINLGRANAIEAAVRSMRFVGCDRDVYLVSFTGGDKDNAIPRSCVLEFAVTDDSDITERIDSAVELIIHELTEDDNPFEAKLEAVSRVDEVISASDTRKIMDFLTQLRSGPVMYSRAIPDMVETSYNLSVVRISTDNAAVTVSSRSSYEYALDDMEYKLEAVARLAGFGVSHRSRYPGWSFAGQSPVLDSYLAAYKNLFGKDGRAMGIHAGLECGLLKQRIPDMDIISIGPDIKDLHSPSETLSISSLDRLYDTVITMLTE